MVTISLGVASRIPFHQNCIESLVSSAEQVLYAAKNRGRDQFCSAADDVNVMADGTV
ncbi:diguanylate cyclase domain-containing protein [Oceanisphaera marina]